MRIALIIEHFDATRGGAEHFTVWLAKELVTRGHEVHVVCHDVAARVNKYRQATQRASHDADRSHQAHISDEVVHEGIRIHRLRGMKLNSGFGFRMFGRRARRWCQTNQPEIAHSMSVAFPGDIYHPHAGVYAAIQAQAVASRATGTSATFKQLMLKFSGKQRTLIALEKRAVQDCGTEPQRIVSLCAMMTEQLKQHYGVNGGCVTELPNPRMTTASEIAPQQMAEGREWFRGHYRINERDKVAIFVGHDFRRKGLRYAIEAIAKTHDWKLLVVGLGKAREYVELADDLGIGDANSGGARVLFVGPTKEMPKMYAAADALILPTFYDSFGLVVLEAFSHGLPVVSTEFLGAAYLVKQHQAGTIVKSPRDVEAMAKALEALPAPDSPEGIALAGRARKASVSMLPGDYMGKMLALYETVLREKGR
jgi:UDP-glucose:(heptosyl)LPS alpha-1,3-glucosyltransferase